MFARASECVCVCVCVYVCASTHPPLPEKSAGSPLARYSTGSQQVVPKRGDGAFNNIECFPARFATGVPVSCFSQLLQDAACVA
jgi:hypothetical protein